MAYTFLALKNKLTTQVGDPNIDSSIVGDAINYTEQAIFDGFELTLNSATQTNAVASGASTLTTALPSDLQRITNIYITSPTAYAESLKKYFLLIDQFREAYPDAGTNTGNLQFWTYFTGVQFAVKANTDFVVKIDYTKAITLMSADADVPTIPQSFEELLVLGAKMRIFEQKEDFDYANQFQNRYADLLESFVTRYSTRQVDAPIVIPGSRVRIGRGRA